MSAVVEGDGVVGVAGDVDSTDGCASVGESYRAVALCIEVLIFSKVGRGG